MTAQRAQPSAVPLPVRLPARVPLAVLPTPLVPAPRLATAFGLGSLYVKRDDLIGFGVAGNKTRPLELLLAAARDCAADVLVTGGSPASNFCAAAAAAARHAGLDCELMLAGVRPRDEAGAEHPNLAAARAWGARLHWTGRADRESVDAALRRLGERLAAHGRRPYTVPRGGATGLGAAGFVAAAFELDAQLRRAAVDAAEVVVAVGSGGTLAGLVVGNIVLGRPWRLAGASVSRPAGEAAARVLALAGECAALVGAPPVAPADVRLVDARGPGHGVPSGPGRYAAETALRTAGLVLDPVYTAKALAAVPSVVADRDAPVVFWHSGGLLDAVAGLTGGLGDGETVP
jgi:1-aminocyclopropane-1-carboxylate deaminase/D-cysteine desulfhydrase-like pyridoxal-dependent ACC family enzyme